MQRQYSDGTADPTWSSSYDGLGRLTSQTSDDLTLDPTYLGGGGVVHRADGDPEGPRRRSPATRSTCRAPTPSAASRPASERRASRVERQGTTLTYDAAGRTGHLDRPERSHDELHRTTPTAPSRPAPCRPAPWSPTPTTRTTGRLHDRDGAADRAVPPSRRPTATSRPGSPARGGCKSISDGTSTVTFGYDADGHVVSRAYSDGTATSATYLDNGQLHTTTDVTGAVTTYVPDSAGAAQDGDPDARGDDAGLGHLHLRRHCRGSATTTRGNGVTTTNSVDARATSSAASARPTASKALVEEHLYTYDTHGNVATRIDTTPSRRHGRPGTSYDAYDRLTRLRRLSRRPRVREAVDGHHATP